MKPNLFITGASGFIGRSLLDHLEPDRYGEVHLLTRRPLLLPKRLAGIARSLQGELGTPGAYREALGENTIVLHLAAATGNAPPAQHRSVNVDGTQALLTACTDAGCRRFVHVSTIAVKFDDISGYPYALTKREAETLVQDAGIEYTIVRPTIVLGPGSSIWRRLRSLACGFRLLVPGTGGVQVQPVWVDDVAVALLHLAEQLEAAGATVDLGGPETLTMQDFLRRARRSSGKRGGSVVHLPLDFLLATLRTVERRLPVRLPVGSGQFSAFLYDGVADGGLVAWPAEHEPIGVDAMLDMLS
jgi:nucleoside-diphosphate-sugar epimerase